jgi:hypothetical protein
MSADYERIFAKYATPPAPGAVVRCFSDIAAKPLRWLWPGRIPLGKLTLLAGDPGLGKTLVALDIIARVTRGLNGPMARHSNIPAAPSFSAPRMTLPTRFVRVLRQRARI